MTRVSRCLSAFVFTIALSATSPMDAQACSSPFNYPVVGDVIDYVVSADGERVVYRADAEQDDVMELFAVRADGGTLAVKLNLPLPAGGGVEAYAISPDSAYVVFLADDQVNGAWSLFSVPITGGVAPTRIDQAVKPDEQPTSFVITADSARVVYFQEDSAVDTKALWAANLTGGGVTLLTPLLASNESMLGWKVSPDSSVIVYTTYEGSGAWQAIYSAPLDASTPRVRLNPPLPPGRSIETDFLITPDGARVLYRSDKSKTVALVDQLWSVPVSGGINKRINHFLQTWGDVYPNPRLSADGTEVIYRADVRANTVDDLWRAPVDGSVAATRISDAVVTGAVGDGWVFNAARDRVVYRARPVGIGNVYKLFSSPTDGSATTLDLSGTMVEDGEVQLELLMGANDRVVYRADQDEYETFELFSVPVDGSATPAKLHPDLVFKEDVERYFRLSEDGGTVFLSTDQAGPEGYFHAYAVPIDATAGLTRLNEVGAVSANSLETRGDLGFWTGVDDLASLTGIVELRSRRLDVSQPSKKLNGPLARGPRDGDVDAFELSEDGTRAIYDARENTGRGAFGVRVDGTGCSNRLAGEPPYEQLGFESIFSPDGNWVAYQAQLVVYGPFRVFVVPYNGGTPVEVSGTLPDSANINHDVFTPDSSRVVFEVVDLGVTEIHSAPIDGLGAIVVCATLPAGAEIEELRVSPDGSRVIYRADVDTPSVPELYSAQVEVSAPSVKLSSPSIGGGSVDVDWLFSPDGTRVLYRAYQASVQRELYSVPIDGSLSSVRLNSPVPTGGSVFTTDLLRFSSDGQTVYYLAQEEEDYRVDLFRVPIDGSSSSLRLNGPLISGANVADVGVFTADDSRVVYSADAWIVDQYELFVVQTDGSQSPTRINQPLPAFGDLVSPAVDATNQWIVAIGDLDVDDRYEIYRIKLDGSVQEKVNDTVVPPNGDLTYRLSPDRRTIVMYGDRAVYARDELYAAPADGSAPFFRLNGGDVHDYQILSDYVLTPDSAGVIYRSDESVDDVFELYYAPLDGSGPSRSLSPRLKSPHKKPQVTPTRKTVIRGTVTKTLGG